MMWDTARRSLLRHFLGAIAYRAQKALRDAPEGFGHFEAGASVRTPQELVYHMGSVLGYARTLFLGGVWRPARLPSFSDEIARLHDILADLGRLVESADAPRDISPEQLLQGPFADTMTHVGQIAMLRRLAGSPVPPENFVFAKVDAKNLGRDQPQPASPDAGWDPDMPSDR